MRKNWPWWPRRWSEDEGWSLPSSSSSSEDEGWWRGCSMFNRARRYPGIPQIWSANPFLRRKKRICRGRGSQRIQSEACTANAVAKKGQRTHVVGGPWSFSSGVSKKGLCGHNSHVLTLMGTTPLDQPTPPMLGCVLLLTLQSATTTTSDLTTTHWSGRKVQGRANGCC